MAETTVRLPAVSVLMPVYNAEDYLDESIGSVLAQTRRDFELICFNDASTDGSIAILNRYAAADSRVRVIDSAENVRQGGGRNRAFKASKGRYVMYLDADDRLVPDALRQCMEAADKHGSEIVFFDYERFSPSTGERQAVCQLGEDAAALEGDALRRRIAQRATPVWSAMYARGIIEGYGLSFPEHVFYEDNAVALAMQLVGRNPVKINAPLYGYRYDNTSVTRSADNPAFFDRIDSAVALLGHLKRLGLYGRFREEIDFMFFNMYYVHTVFGAIYRFSRVQADRIRQVRAGLRGYLPDYRRNSYYRAMAAMLKFKIFTHTRFPHLIKALSNLSRRFR